MKRDISKVGSKVGCLVISLDKLTALYVKYHESDPPERRWHLCFKMSDTENLTAFYSGKEECLKDYDHIVKEWRG